MTLSAWLTLLAVIVAAAGLILTARLRGLRQLVGLLTTLVAVVVTGWFAWYASIQV